MRTLEKTQVTQDVLNIFNRFRTCGLKAIVQHSEDKTVFHFQGGMSKRIKIITFEVDRGKDLYNLEFGKNFRGSYKVVDSYEGLFVDQLVPMFEEITGFYTTIF